MHFVLWALTPAAVLVIIGCVYQSIGCERDRRRYAGAGRWITTKSAAAFIFLNKATAAQQSFSKAALAPPT